MQMSSCLSIRAGFYLHLGLGDTLGIGQITVGFTRHQQGFCATRCHLRQREMSTLESEMRRDHLPFHRHCHRHETSWQRNELLRLPWFEYRGKRRRAVDLFHRIDWKPAIKRLISIEFFNEENHSPYCTLRWYLVWSLCTRTRRLCPRNSWSFRNFGIPPVFQSVYPKFSRIVDESRFLLRQNVLSRALWRAKLWRTDDLRRSWPCPNRPISMYPHVPWRFVVERQGDDEPNERWLV